MTPFAWFVARRYLTARRKQAFISLISGVSMLGVAVGVAALIIALALMTGLQTEMRDRIVSSAAHLYIYKAGDKAFSSIEADAATVMATPGVIGAAPAVIGKGMVQGAGNAQAFATIKGIDVALEPKVTGIVDGMRSGSLNALLHRSDDQLPGIILGVDLATSIGAHVGDRLRVLTPEGPMSPSGRLPGNRPFEVVGTFQLGLYELDSSWALISMPVAVEFLRREGPDFIQARVDKMFEAQRIGDAVEESLGPMYTVENWTQMNKALYSALYLEKIAISLTIGLVVMVAALNIVASLVLLVMEKSRDIAILRTMGAPAKAIRLIFMLQGLVIGAIGTGVGTALGLMVSYVCDRFQLITLPGDVYQITHVPFRTEPLDVIFVVVAAIVICWLATIYPARRAAQLDPAEALRYQ